MSAKQDVPPKDWTELMAGIQRVEVDLMEISTEDDDGELWWYAYKVTGPTNDRDWKPVARASEFGALLRLLGRTND